MPAVLCCKVGADSFGDFVEETVRASGADIRGIVRDPAVNTTVSIVCVQSSGERSFLYCPGSTSAFTAADVPDALLEEADIVFIAGAMLLTAFDGAGAAQVLERARRMGKTTVMDTAWDFQDVWLPKVEAALPHLDLFMPSVEEAAKLTGETEPERIADRLLEMGPKSVVVKTGKNRCAAVPGRRTAAAGADLAVGEGGGYHRCWGRLLCRIPRGDGAGMGFHPLRRLRKCGRHPLCDGHRRVHRYPADC